LRASFGDGIDQRQQRGIVVFGLRHARRRDEMILA